MSNRIYVVKYESGAEPYSEILVKAVTAAAAIRHVASPMFTAKVASQDDLIRLAKTHHVKEA